MESRRKNTKQKRRKDVSKLGGLKPEQVFKVPVGMYLRNLYCVINCSNKEFNDYIFKTWKIKRKSEKTYIAEIATVTNPKNNSTRFFFWIKKIDIKTNNINLIQIISHEMDHLGFEVFEYFGIPVGVRNQEAKCYFTDEVLAKVLRKLKALKKIKL